MYNYKNRLQKKLFSKIKDKFSFDQYNEYIKAYKEVFPNDKNIRKTLYMQLRLIEILPCYYVLFTSLFHNSRHQINLVNKYLNKNQKSILVQISNITHINYTSPKYFKDLGILLDYFKLNIKLVYVFIANQYSESKLIKNKTIKFKQEYVNYLLKIVIPITNQMGIYNLMIHFQNIALSIKHPKEYSSIINQKKIYGSKIHKDFKSIMLNIENIIIKHNIKAQIIGRIKSLYSIFIKLKEKNLYKISDLNDILAIRILVNSEVECYKILHLIHNNFGYKKEKLKDFIFMPKHNSYQSLHTILLVPHKNTTLSVEIQIRTYKMHNIAENGIASHFLYKNKNISYKEKVELYSFMKFLKH